MAPANLLAARIVAIILLLTGTFGFGVAPLALQKQLMQCDCGAICKPGCKARKWKLTTSFLIYLGGGVLLATCFIHLLPEAREGLEQKHEDGHETFPLPEFIVCLGFFAVYLFEQIITHFVGGHTHLPTITRAIRSISRSNSCPSCNTPAFLSNSIEISRSQHLKARLSNFPPPPVITAQDTTQLSISGLLTVAALSFHSLFEGFAVGLQSSAANTWILFAAVAVHKYVISFVVGVEVLATGGGRRQLLAYMGVFSFMSPIGMAIAMITAINVEESDPVVVSVLNAIATGTLLYVTFFEILQNDEHKDVIPSKVQFLATFFGFGVMCIVQYGSTFA